MKLTDNEIRDINRYLEAGKSIPSYLLQKISPESLKNNELGKEYRLVYDGKMRREEILANTPAAPWQLVRRFSSDNPHAEKKWHNLLVWGDNLLALRELLADQQGKDKYGTRGKIKLIYIDPPFATKQDFMKDQEKAYRDKVIGSEFIEFLRKRLMLLREILAEDGSIFVHLDWKKGHYIKVVLDEVFGENNFRNEITWKGADSHNDSKRLAIVDNKIFWYSKTEDYFYNPVYLEYSIDYLNQFYNNVEITTDGDKRRFRWDHFTKPKGSVGYFYKYKGCSPPPNGWRCPIETMDMWEKKGVLEVKGKRIYKKRYLDEQPGKQVTSVWEDITGQLRSEDASYPTQKPEKLLERIISLGSKEDDIILDSFSGSGTSIAVAEKLKRRWIAMD